MTHQRESLIASFAFFGIWGIFLPVAMFLAFLLTLLVPDGFEIVVFAIAFVSYVIAGALGINFLLRCPICKSHPSIHKSVVRAAGRTCNVCGFDFTADRIKRPSPFTESGSEAVSQSAAKHPG